jgi:hypothetical protein
MFGDKRVLDTSLIPLSALHYYEFRTTVMKSEREQ